MIFYVDASLAVSLFVHDAHTQSADDWIERAVGSMVISDLCAIEFAAAISRLMRISRLSVTDAEVALKDFDGWRSNFALPLYVASADIAVAEGLVRDFSTKLAAADAIHLAAAMNAGASLVTFDARLAEAARARGVGVIVP